MRISQQGSKDEGNLTRKEIDLHFVHQCIHGLSLIIKVAFLRHLSESLIMFISLLIICHLSWRKGAQIKEGK